MYKKLKYNLMLVLLIAVIGIFLGATSVLSSVSDVNLNPNPNTDNQIELEENQNQMPTGKFNPPSATAGAFTRIDFAFKVLKEGDGFKSETTQTVVSMGQVQNIFTRALRAGEIDFVEEWQYSNTSFAKNEFVSRYNDGTTVKTNIIKNKSKFSGESKSYQEGFADERLEISTKNFVERVGNFNDFPLTVNANTSTVTRYDKVSDKNNYIISVSFNVSKINQKYLNAFVDNGTQDVNFKEISITFRINKKTGFLASISKNEKFSTVYTGISVNCDANLTTTFLKVNTSMQTEINQKVAKNFK